MFQKKRFVVFVFIMISILISACGGDARTAADVVEEYVAALVDKNDVQAVNLSCVEWEESAQAEGAAFEGVEVALEGVECNVVEEDGETATVSCSGKIVFSYAGGENEEIDLERRDYHVVFESGEWRMCGYK
jgi:hypothetical protein